MSGPEGTRTPDPLHAMQVRYQLRHRPKARLVYTIIKWLGQLGSLAIDVQASRTLAPARA